MNQRVPSIGNAAKGNLASCDGAAIHGDTGVDAGSTPGSKCLSVVIPAYNEAKTLSVVVRKVMDVPIVGEVIVVDDASTDGTSDVVEVLRLTCPIKVILHKVNRGKGAAIRSALAIVTYPFVVVQDADLEYDPEEFSRLIVPLRQGKADAVYGSRYLGAPKAPRWHSIANRCLTFLSNTLTGRHLTDMETCYKMFRTGLLPRFILRCDRFGFEPEITARLAQCGARIRELPISYLKRGYSDGKKITFLDGIKTVFTMILCSLTR